MRKFCKVLKIKNLMPQHIQISFRPQLLCPSLPAMEISVAQSELAPKPLALHELLTLPPSSERSVGFGFRRFFISDCRAGCVCPENTEPMHMHYICKCLMNSGERLIILVNTIISTWEGSLLSAAGAPYPTDLSLPQISFDRRSQLLKWKAVSFRHYPHKTHWLS